MNFNIEIAHEEPNWNTYSEINPQFISIFLTNILSRYENFANISQFELSILLTDDKKMQSLNLEFLDKNYPTNVLSFPDMELDYKDILEFKPEKDYMYLGDIAFGFQIIDAEAKSKNLQFMAHFKHLLVHSILHLIGYDHKNDQDAETMESLEIKILKDFGLISPY